MQIHSPGHTPPQVSCYGSIYYVFEAKERKLLFLQSFKSWIRIRSHIEKAAGSGSAKNESGSTALIKSSRSGSSSCYLGIFGNYLQKHLTNNQKDESSEPTTSIYMF